MEIVLRISEAQHDVVLDALGTLDAAFYNGFLEFHKSATAAYLNEVRYVGWKTQGGNAVATYALPGPVASEYRLYIHSRRHALHDDGNGVGRVMAAMQSQDARWPACTLHDGSIMAYASESDAPWFQAGVRRITYGLGQYAMPNRPYGLELAVWRSRLADRSYNRQLDAAYIEQDTDRPGARRRQRRPRRHTPMQARS